jgi:hypothetical protein
LERGANSVPADTMQFRQFVFGRQQTADHVPAVYDIGY